MQQVTIFEAIAEREVAFERIEKADPKAVFATAFDAFLLDYCLTHRGQEATGEDLTDRYLERGLPMPGDLRWVGPRVQAAARRGALEDTGRRAPRRRGHGSAGAIVWRCVGAR